MQMLKGLTVALVGAGLLASLTVAQEKKAKQDEKATPGIGDAGPEFELKSCEGKDYKLADLKDKVVVLEWINYRCPVSDGARSFMKETSDTYTGKGVVWLAIDSTWNNKPDEVAKYNKEKGVDYPVLMDPEGTVGHAYGAKTTPHIFILNKGKLVYMGAHDKGDRNYIAEALDAVLAGKDVPLAETKPYGCGVKYKKKQD